MINRAKCKLCNKIIESHLPDEIIMCPCGTIGVADGAAMRTYCKDNRYSEYFARVDDMGHEIPVEYRKEPTDVKGNESANKPIEPLRRDELINMFDEMIKSIENLPQHAQLAPVNSIDLISFMLVISNIFKRG